MFFSRVAHCLARGLQGRSGVQQRHRFRRTVERARRTRGYDPLYWGAVFPLGMYTVCTFRVAGMLDEPPLLIIPRVYLYVALGAWTLTFTGLLGSLAKKS